MATIHNGVDVPVDLNRIQRNCELRLLFIGRLDPKKGIEALLKACSLVDSTPPWRLAIAGWGEPEYVSQLKEQIHALGVSERVEMLGAVLAEGKKGLFERSYIALVPSYTEDFGIVVAEALPHGVPVMASKETPWSRLEELQGGLWEDMDPES